MLTKTCTSCKRELPIDDFYKWNKSEDGHHYCCKHCHKEQRNNQKQRNKNVVIPETKLCGCCGKVQSSDEFWKNASNADGLTTYCISCNKTQNKTAVYKYVEANKKFIDWTGTKICPTCSQDKHKTDFHKHLYHKDGLSSSCKQCTKDDEYTDKKLLQKMVTRARHRARKHDIPFDIDNKYIQEIMTSTCPMLHIPLCNPTVDGDNNISSDNSPSIDRIINSKGYVKGNVVVVSYRANRIKNDASLEELESIVEFLQNHRDNC